MTVALTAVRISPLENEASFRKIFAHIVEVDLTAANTDTTVDFAALGAADTLNAVNGLYLATVLARAGKILNVFEFHSNRGAGSATLSFLSAASAGGAATETYTVTGLAVGDVVEAVTPAITSPNAVYTKAYGTVAANALPVTYSGDPGVGAKVKVTVLRAGGVNGSDYVVGGTVTAPTATFAGGGSTPTVLNFVLMVEILPGYPPVRTPNVD